MAKQGQPPNPTPTFMRFSNQIALIPLRLASDFRFRNQFDTAVQNRKIGQVKKLLKQAGLTVPHTVKIIGGGRNPVATVVITLADAYDAITGLGAEYQLRLNIGPSF